MSERKYGGINMVTFDEIDRTDEQIKRLKEAIQKALDKRPEFNADDRTEMKQLIEELNDALNGKLPSDKTGELYWWLIGKSSLLAQNFGIEEYD
jgi:hypothetical protein